MKRKMSIVAIIILTLMLCGRMVAADEQAWLWIAVDTSGSAPLFAEPPAASQAGRTASQAIRELGPGDHLRILSFGEAGVSGTQIDISITMRGQHRPDTVAPVIEQIFSDFPVLVENGDLRVEGQTNLLDWFERIGPMLNCQAEPTTLLIFTDAIEFSAAIDGNDLIAGVPLPAPSGRILEGCHVVFWGVGQQQTQYGNDGAWYPTLRSTWAVYTRQAGVASFAAYANYGR